MKAKCIWILARFLVVDSDILNHVSEILNLMLILPMVHARHIIR